MKRRKLKDAQAVVKPVDRPYRPSSEIDSLFRSEVRRFTDRQPCGGGFRIVRKGRSDGNY